MPGRGLPRAGFQPGGVRIPVHRCRSSQNHLRSRERGEDLVARVRCVECGRTAGGVPVSQRAPGSPWRGGVGVAFPARAAQAGCLQEAPCVLGPALQVLHNACLSRLRGGGGERGGTGPVRTPLRQGAGCKEMSPLIASGYSWRAQHPKKPCYGSEVVQHHHSMARLLTPGRDHGNISLFRSKYPFFFFFCDSRASSQPCSGTGAASGVLHGRPQQRGRVCLCRGVTLLSCFVSCVPLGSSAVDGVARSWFGFNPPCQPGLDPAPAPGSGSSWLCRGDFPPGGDVTAPSQFKTYLEDLSSVSMRGCCRGAGRSCHTKYFSGRSSAPIYPALAAGS